MISIVVPVYKVEPYLPACIESLMKQTFRDIEIILVDDGSPDNCPAICDEYAKKDSRIQVIHKQNGGLSCARNTGVDAAKGEYICFVDSDDLVSTTYCESLYRLLENTDYDFSVCGVQRFQDEISVLSEKEEITVMSNTEYLEAQLCRKTEFGVWNKLYRRRLFDRICFAAGKIHEDVIWSGDLLRQSHGGVICTSQKLYHYRQRAGSIVADGAAKCSTDRVYAGRYLVETAELKCPQLKEACLRYAVEYPWMFVDGIYVHRTFAENREFLRALQALLRRYGDEYRGMEAFSAIQRKRMRCFSESTVLYGVNAYSRLLRNYIFRLLRMDPYRDGHGI